MQMKITKMIISNAMDAFQTYKKQHMIYSPK